MPLRHAFTICNFKQLRGLHESAGLCIEVLKAEKMKTHLQEIAGALVARYPAERDKEDMEESARKVGQSIGSHIRSAKGNF